MVCDRIVILAAGRARRMKESATASNGGGIWLADAQDRPKPMIRVGPNGEPLLQFILEQSLSAGFTEATVVIAPDDEITQPFVQAWNETGVGPKLRIRCVVQAEPRGTGHAVQCALLQDPVPRGKTWVLCNGDNVPSRAALARLRGVPEGQALLAYDRNALGLDPAKTMAFAVLEGDGDRIRRIVEKPSEAEVAALAERGAVRVSMNIFRLDSERLMPFLEALEPHPVRGEWELPTALQAMMDAGHPIEQLDIAEEVLDLTRITDVVAVQSGLHMMEAIQLEVCASSPSDVRTAAEAGAMRVELCAHWECGGLTSPESDVRAAMKFGIPVHALIRCRAGHFVYSPEEKRLMLDQMQAALEAGASRVVIGALTQEGNLDVEWIRECAAAVGSHRLVIHRALDAAVDWEAAVRSLMECGICHVLTSGGEAVAWEGRERITSLMHHGFQVTVGSGVRANQKRAWMERDVRSFHASCRHTIERPTRLFDGVTHPVSAEAVRSWF